MLPAVVLEGAKAVGKTATAERRAAETFSLDRENTRRTIMSDPSLVLRGRPPTLIDEWQRVPAVWDEVRYAVDHGDGAGRFLLAGSAQPSKAANLHSGAGRMVSLTMRPMSLPERAVEEPTISFSELLSGTRPAVEGATELGVGDYAELIVASGFPGICSAEAPARPHLLNGYIRRIVEHDILALGAGVRRPSALLAWLAAYGAATATTASYSNLLDAATPGVDAKPSKEAAAAYRDLLTRMWILEPLPAWTPSFAHLRRLGQAPKHHLVDPALAARLVGATVGSLVRGTSEPQLRRDTTFLSALFESLATQTVRVLAEPHMAAVSHLRMRGGEREIDLIVARDDLRVLAIEVKMGSDIGPRDVAHLHWLEGELPGRVLDKVVLTAGRFAHRRPDGVAVVPLALLGP
jgi:predicted AAA+ superfamily ATPase